MYNNLLAVAETAPRRPRQVEEVLARHPKIDRVEFVGSFPLGPGGQVLKRELVLRYSG